jgi:hypothetical protein
VSAVDRVRPMLSKILDREWDRLLKPFLLKRLSLYLKEIEEIQAVQPTGDDARDAERLNWLESTMREYGDGYTEPREASIDWIGWQQSPEESHFPGIRKAIDAAMDAMQATP